MSTVLPKPSEPRNLGASTRPILRPANHPDSDALARERAAARSTESQVDVLLVNPPSPDGGIWIRTQHRVGRRSRENMIWPQVSLAQLAALLLPTYRWRSSTPSPCAWTGRRSRRCCATAGRATT